MNLWEAMRALFSLPPLPRRRTFAVDEELYGAVRDLAAWEQRPPDEVARDLVAEALERRRVTQASLELWQALSRREQEVTALVCLGCTSPQVAARLSISSLTVKTHVANILQKAGLRSRQQLRAVFSGWNFAGED
jgi:DNA-binding NarL/FixJ family response regulator